MSFILLGILNAQVEAAGGAGSYDLLETTVLTSSASSVTFTGLDTLASGYQHLQIRAVMQDTSAGTSLEVVGVQFNGDTTNSYARHTLLGNGSSVVSDNTTSFGSILLVGAAGRETNIFGASVIDILDFSSTSKNTTLRALTGGNASAANTIALSSGGYFKTDAITSVTMIARGTAFATNSRFSLFGIKGA
jgi:hypothetical protein